MGATPANVVEHPELVADRIERFAKLLGRGAGDQDAQGAVNDVGQLRRRHHRIDEPLVEEVLGNLDILRERGAVDGLVDAGAEEAQQRAGTCDRDVGERSPRCHDSAGGGVPQVDELGQSGLAVGAHGRTNFSPLTGMRWFLPAGVILPMPGRPGAASPPGFAHSTAVTIRSAAARPMEPPRKRNSLTIYSHRSAADAAFAGEDRFAHTGLCPGGREFLMGPGSGSTTLRCPEVLYLVGGFTRGQWAGRR